MLQRLNIAVGAASGQTAAAAATHAAIRSDQSIQSVTAVQAAHRRRSSDGRVAQVDGRQERRRRHSTTLRIVAVKLVADYIVRLQQSLFQTRMNTHTCELNATHYTTHKVVVVVVVFLMATIE